MFGTRFAALCLLAVMAFAPSANAGDDCAPFPRLALWGEYTHETVRKHVNEALGGDWRRYVDGLQSQLVTLRRLLRRGSGVAISRDGRTVELTGTRLAQYIKHADRRLGVARCLAASADAGTIASFPTAAGTSAADKPDTAPAGAGDHRMPRSDNTITIPETTFDQLRRMAVRRSVKDARYTSVNDVVVELLERELRRARR